MNSNLPVFDKDKGMISRFLYYHNAAYIIIGPFNVHFLNVFSRIRCLVKKITQVTM